MKYELTEVSADDIQLPGKQKNHGERTKFGFSLKQKKVQVHSTYKQVSNVKFEERHLAYVQFSENEILTSFVGVGSQ